ncbi:MAG: PAS domain S-box protein [Bacteroidota bacterium]|nr:PAS domain S-box protein [Bacteroidota bacterium]
MKTMKNLKGTSLLISRTASFIIIIAGSIALVDWTFNLFLLKRIFPFSGVIMRFDTALCFILSGLNLYLLEVKNTNRLQPKMIRIICSWVILIVGLLSFSQYILNWHLGIDELMWGKTSGIHNSYFSDQMSLIGSLNFTLLGLIFLMLGRRKYNWIIYSMLVVMIPGTILVVLNNLFGISFLKAIQLSVPTSMEAALLFTILSISIFFRQELGFLQLSFVKKITIFFVALILFRSCLFFAVNKNNEKAAETYKSEEQTHQVVFLMEQLNSISDEIQSGVMNYIITGSENDSSFIAPLSAKTDLVIARLSKLSRNNADLNQRIDSLGRYLKSYIKFQNELVAIRREEGFESARKEMLGSREKLLLKNVHSLVNEMEQEENYRVAKNKLISELSIQNSSKLFTLFQVIAFLLLLIALRMIYNNSRKRNKIEEALNNSLKDTSDYRYALDESSILVITDKNGIIRQVNDNFCKITQYTREELIGQDHRIINSGYHTTEFMRDLWVTIHNGEVWKGEMKNKAKDGTSFWLDTTIVPFMDEHGKPYQFVAIRSDITERKILEDEIKQLNRELEQKVKDRTEELTIKENQLRSIFNSVADIIFVLDVEEDENFRYSSVNPAFVKTTGLDYSQVVGKNVFDVIPKELLDSVIQNYKEAIRTKEIVRWEETSDYPAGKLIGEVSIVPIFDDAGNCLRLIGSIHDLTERKRVEKALAKSENYLRTIIHAEPECVKLLDRNGTLQDMNPAGLTMIEADSLQQVKGKSVLGIVDSIYREQFNKLIENVFEGMPGEMEFEITGLKGTRRWLEMHTVPLLNDEGQIISLLGVTRDVTERRKTEENLKESLLRYEIVSKATKDVIWEWDLNTNIVTRNDMFINLYGYSKKQVKNNHDWLLENIHPDDKEKFIMNIKNCLENKLEYCQDEYRLRAADGSYRDVYDRAFVLFDEQGNPSRMIGAMTDLTDKKILEKELSEQRLKQQQLIMGVAIESQEKEKNELGKELHDNINQILATVKIYLGMLKSSRDLPEEDLLGKSYDYVNLAMDELRKLSHSLVAPSLGNIGLEEALEGLVNDAKLINKLKVQLSVDEKYKTQDIDKNVELMFYRIVQEQLNNIFKYANATNVIIRLKKENNNLVLSINDNGVGFDVLEKVSGIGLKNINNRVMFYSGNMNVVSAPGKGCTLKVAVPVCAVS